MDMVIRDVGEGYTVMAPQEQETNMVILDYLIDNQEHLRELMKPYQEQRDKLLSKNIREHYKDIQSQYINLAMYLIAEKIAEKSGVDTESTIVMLESFDLDEYLNGTG